jgi:hypothetical protein
MPRFADWRPTALDPRGLGPDDQSDWRVLPTSRTRDSEALDESNYQAALKCLADADPTGENYETHRFGHWGPGWVEIIVVKPGTAAHEEAVRIECSLADCPVLDESDYSDREHEEQLSRLESIIRDIERAADDASESDDSEEWDVSELAAEVSSALDNGLSELSSRATEQVTNALVDLGYLTR